MKEPKGEPTVKAIGFSKQFAQIMVLQPQRKITFGTIMRLAWPTSRWPVMRC
jgi:hypothetical protein